MMLLEHLREGALRQMMLSECLKEGKLRQIPMGEALGSPEPPRILCPIQYHKSKHFVPTVTRKLPLGRPCLHKSQAWSSAHQGRKITSQQQCHLHTSPGQPMPSLSQMLAPICGELEQQVPSLCPEACDSLVTSGILLKASTQEIPTGT